MQSRSLANFGVQILLEGAHTQSILQHMRLSMLVQVWVKIVDIQEDGHGPVKLNCSMKAVDQDSGADLDPENKMARQRQAGGRDGPVSDEPPELGSIHRASVASLRPFGAFVRIEGYRSNGLVHFSQAGIFAKENIAT